MAKISTGQMLRVLGYTAAIVLPAPLAVSLAVPARAQISVSIGFSDFHSRLAPYGRWSNHPRWGEVWHPTQVARDFRPYYYGHWVNTREYGWMWVSDESWGDIPYHYGRWVFDPSEGWLWVPGYVWGPSWVVWRSGGGNIGWFPMPPGDDYYGNGAYRGNFDNEYGYRDWYGSSFDNNQFLSLWIFVGENHFGDRDFRNYAVPRRDYDRFIGQTRDSTNYTTVNNYVVNRSVDANRLRQDTRQRFAPVAARSVIRDTALVTPATLGRQVEQRERRQHPIPASQAVQEPAAATSPDRATRQPERNAPAANVPKASQALQGRQGRGNERNPATAASPAAPEAPRAAPIAPTPPAAGLPQPNANQPRQSRQGRGNERNVPATGAIETTPQAQRVAPMVPTPPPAPATPTGDRSGRANPQTGRDTMISPQTRATPQRSGGNTEAQAPARVQEKAPAARDRGNAQGTNAPGNRQGGPKNANDPNGIGDRKNAHGDRGQSN
jgi:Family of unknown function (DUF6600)